MSSIHTRSIREHGDALRKGEYSSEELTRHFLARIEAESGLNAFITITEEHALAQARLADQVLARNEGSELPGMF